MRLARLRYDTRIIDVNESSIISRGAIIQVVIHARLASWCRCRVPGYPALVYMHMKELEFLDEVSPHPPEEV